MDSAISSFKDIEKLVERKESIQKDVVSLGGFISDLEGMNLKQFDGLDEASEMLVSITVASDEIDLLETQYESLLRLRTTASNLVSQEKAISKALDGESLLDDILAINDDKIALIAVSNEIRGAIESIYSIKEELASFDHLDDALKAIEEMGGMPAKIDELEYDHQALKDCLINFTNHKNMIKILDGRIEEMEAELKEEMGDTCALCGSKL